MFAKEDQAKKDAFDESDDESAISRTESELREVTKVLFHCRLRLLSSQDRSVLKDCEAAMGHWEIGGCKGPGCVTHDVLSGSHVGNLPVAVLYYCCKRVYQHSGKAFKITSDFMKS